MEQKQKELLLKLRGHLAYKFGCPPYIVCKDEELEEILRVKPKTLEELQKVKGFPEEGKRIKNWGIAITDIFNRTEEVEDFELIGEGNDLSIYSKVKTMGIF